MNRALRTWSIFTTCALLGVGALAWVSRVALRLEDREAQVSRQAALEEKVRLALWRMDSALAPLVATESARPENHYLPYFPAEGTYTAGFTELPPGRIILLSPLRAVQIPHVLAHFQIDEQGIFSSPLTAHLNRPADVEPERISQAQLRLKELQHRLNRDQLMADLRSNAPEVALPEPTLAKLPQTNEKIAMKTASKGRIEAKPDLFVHDKTTELESPKVDRRDSNALADRLESKLTQTASVPSIKPAVDDAKIAITPTTLPSHVETVRIVPPDQAKPLPVQQNPQIARNQSEYEARVNVQMFTNAVNLPFSAPSSRSKQKSSSPSKTAPPKVTKAPQPASAPQPTSVSSFQEAKKPQTTGQDTNPLQAAQEENVLPPPQPTPAMASVLEAPKPKEEPATVKENASTVQAEGKTVAAELGVVPVLKDSAKDRIDPDRKSTAVGKTAVGMRRIKAASHESSSPTRIRAMQGVWVGETLLLARQVGNRIQGCWLDWSSLRTWLRGSIADLLPEADLLPMVGKANGDQGRWLAALPLRLVPGPIPEEPPIFLTPMKASLLFGWGCALLAILAAAVLMQQALSLSERRGAFVSAVTHELRTPLTTFRMYAEMLLLGMVNDEKERNFFHQTLMNQADRLDHLVKNVLAYARLEADRAPTARVELALAELLERPYEHLSQHADHVGMSLLIELPEELRNLTLKTDPSAVEQILFNLVDNACKYAAMATLKLIHIQAMKEGDTVLLRIRDHGPGIVDRRRLFQPFSKSSHDAACSAPGVGLGLALCRRLARNLGGSLDYDTNWEDGACFVLKLPMG